MQLIDVIEHFLKMNNTELALEYTIYATSLVLSMIEFGIDPRNILSVILKTIRSIDQPVDEIFDYFLITMSQIIHNISPFYLRNALDIVKV